MRTIILLCFFFSMQFCQAQTDTPLEQKSATENVDENKVYQASEVDVKPEFPGGINKIMKFLLKNFDASSDEVMNSGKVLVTFIVEKDGTLSDIQAKRSKDNATIDGLVKVMKATPNWSPGKINDKVVRCSFTLPVTLSSQ